MLFLLHGSDVGSSRQALIDLRSNYSPDSITTFAADKFDLDEFKRVSATPSMFADKRLVVIEGNLSASAIKQFSHLTIPPHTDVIFWLDEPLKPSHKLFKLVGDSGGQVRLFREKIPKHVFGLLDALGCRSKKKAFLELHRLLDQGEAPLYLLTMIVWQFRNLLNVKLQSSNIKRMNPFVRRKSTTQAKNYKEDELLGVFRELLDAEVRIKTTKLDPILILDNLVGHVTGN